MSNTPPIRVIIADRHPVMRTILRNLCARLPGITLIGQARDGPEAVQLVRQHQPDILLMDIYLPQQNGFQTAEQILASSFPCPIILTATDSSPTLSQYAKEIGVSGFIAKADLVAELSTAIHTIHQGDTYFSATTNM